MAREIRDVSAADPLFMQSAQSTVVKQADGSFIEMIGSVLSKWAVDFNNTGAGIDPTQWDVLRNTGMTVNTTGGTLNVTTGTAPGNEFLMVGKVGSTVPANLMATWMRSNVTLGTNAQFIRFGYVEVDPVTGVPVPHATLPGDFRNRASFGQGRIVTGDNVNTYALETISNNGPIRLNFSGSLQASSANIDMSLELRADDAIATARGSDSAASNGASACRVSSAVPDPNKVYRPFIWILNGAGTTASIAVTIWRVLSMDIQEVQVEVGGGRGNSTAAQAVPTYSTGGVVSVSGSNVNSGNNSVTLHDRVAADGTNALLIKNGAGRISTGVITNFSANWRFVKFYNKTSAPVPGTDTPLMTLPLPPNSRTMLAEMFDMYGLYFASGISYALTGALAPTDATGITAGDVHVNFGYA